MDWRSAESPVFENTPLIVDARPPGEWSGVTLVFEKYNTGTDRAKHMTYNMVQRTVRPPARGLKLGSSDALLCMISQGTILSWEIYL